MKALNLPTPCAFVFTAGAARCAAQVGMIKAALEHGLVPDLVLGTSAGAVNAAIFAIDPRESVDRLEATWEAVASDSVLSSTWRNAVRGMTGRQSNRTATRLALHLDRTLAEKSFADVAHPLTLLATDLDRGMAVEIETGSITAAVLASCAFPLMLPPAEFEDMLVIDGCVVSGTPVVQAVARGAQSIVLFDTGGSAVSEDDLADLNWYEVMALAFNHLVRGQTAHDLSRVAAQVPVVVASCDEGSPLDLKAAPLLFDIGEDRAASAFGSLPDSIRHPGLYGVPIGLASDHRLQPLFR